MPKAVYLSADTSGWNVPERSVKMGQLEKGASPLELTPQNACGKKLCVSLNIWMTNTPY